MIMFNKHIHFSRVQLKTILTTALICFFLTINACSSNDNDDDKEDDNDQSGATETFTISADEAQEVPATGSTATATGAFELDADSGALTGNLTSAEIVATAAHIHEGFAGTNGGVIIALEITGSTISVPENTVLDTAQVQAMNAGNYYVNIHSDAFPAGEIRGQIAPDGVDVILSTLSGENEVPPVTSSASGKAYTTVNTSTGSVRINVITSGIATPQAAHLHSGFAGINGGVLIALSQDSSDPGRFSSADQATLDASALTGFNNGETYINVHSAENASGELRGQVLPDGVSVLSASLSGDQEVPAVTTSATGSGFVTLNENNSTLVANISTTDVDDATAAHIHEAPAGSNGGVVIGLQQDSESLGNWSVGETLITAEQITTLKAEGMYFNVHTPTNPSGEIRGQIEP